MRSKLGGGTFVCGRRRRRLAGRPGTLSLVGRLYENRKVWRGVMEDEGCRFGDREALSLYGRLKHAHDDPRG